MKGNLKLILMNNNNANISGTQESLYRGLKIPPTPNKWMSVKLFESKVCNPSPGLLYLISSLLRPYLPDKFIKTVWGVKSAI